MSVVIATYNCAKYLSQAVESVLAQTYHDYELIVVNDGSTDDTDDVVKLFLVDPRVRYYKTSHCGAARARNDAVSKAQGEYIAILDADDFWDSRKLEKQIEVFRRNRAAGVVYSDRMMVDSVGEVLPSEGRLLFRGNVLPQLYGNNFVTSSSCMVRRDLLVRYGGFDASLEKGEDYDLWLRLSLFTEFDYVPEKLAAYRVRNGQLSSDCEAVAFWAGIIQERFRENHRSHVTRQMVRNCDWERTYMKFRRYENTRPVMALLAVGRMFMLRPLNRTPYRSLARLIWVNGGSRIRRRRYDESGVFCSSEDTKLL